MRTYYTYIMASHKDGVIYVGITNNIVRRSIEHKKGIGSAYTRRHTIKKLVWFEEYQWVQDAIAREKQIKGWRREKKIRLIESQNPEWRDMSDYPSLRSG